MRPFLLAVVLVGCAPARTIPPRAALPDLLSSTAPPPARMRMHVIDVGQGSAALFEFPCAAVLVDTGGEATDFDGGKAAVEYLERFFARRTDLDRTLASVIITHPHIDHTRGLPEILRRFTVKKLVTNGLAKGPGGEIFESGGEAQWNAEEQFRATGSLRAVLRNEVEPGQGLTDDFIDPVRCGDVDPTITAWWGGLTSNWEAWDTPYYRNANNHSVVLKVGVGGHHVLVTGDLEVEGLHALLKLHGEALDADVYVVGHHGSHNGTTLELMNVVTPCLAAISMGDRKRERDYSAWSYGHPRRGAVETVNQALRCSRVAKMVWVADGTRRFADFTVERGLYGTGWDGTVVMELSERGTWRADVERPSPSPVAAGR